MKSIFLTIACTVFTLTAFSQVIGKLENNEPVITADIPKLCKTLSDNLKSKSSLNVTFSSARLFKKDDYYILEFKGQQYASSFRVVADSNGDLKADGKTNCMTSSTKGGENNYGCRPTANFGDCVCSPCPEGEVCTKTCTSFSLLE